MKFVATPFWLHVTDSSWSFRPDIYKEQNFIQKTKSVGPYYYIIIMFLVMHLIRHAFWTVLFVIFWDIVECRGFVWKETLQTTNKRRLKKVLSLSGRGNLGDWTRFSPPPPFWNHRTVTTPKSTSSHQEIKRKLSLSVKTTIIILISLS